MTTQRNHTQRRQPQYAKYATCQPSHSAPPTVTCYSTPSLNAPQETMPNSRSAKFDRTLQNPTKSYGNSCVRVRARTRAWCFSSRHSHTLPRHSRESGNPRARPRWRRYLLSAWIAPRPQQIRRITWSRRPRTLMPIDRTEPSERRGLLRGTVWIVLELQNDGGAI